jgi:ribosomal protein S18 acetylase RimI-like enzyme
MAARLNIAPLRPPEIVDLRTLSARDLEPLLQEEMTAWRDALEWQFDQSAALVRRFVDLRALNGSALIEDGQAVGYVYYVLEEDKGLIGDLYVRSDYRSADRENQLLESAIEAIVPNRHINRIESQLLMLAYEPARVLPRGEHVSVYERNFMRADLRCAALPEGPIHRPIFIQRWTDHDHDAAAQLIATAYAGHVDSRINDQYRSAVGARRFLYNIVQYPGCGTFYRPASYTAFEAQTGRLCGISLASLVAPNCGHITQICVSNSVRGTGVGRELLRRSLATLRESGCASASLTVTAANEGAVKLYERVGFQTIRRFFAYAWEGF